MPNGLTTVIAKLDTETHRKLKVLSAGLDIPVQHLTVQAIQEFLQNNTETIDLIRHHKNEELAQLLDVTYVRPDFKPSVS